MRNTRTWFALLFCSLMLVSVPALAQWQDMPGDVPYVPTPPEVVEAMLKLADVKSSDFVIDLGCGDGRIVVMAAQKFGARGMGVDLNPERVKEANANAQQAAVTDRVKFVEKNLFDADLSGATVVTLYLLPDVNLRLRPKLMKDLKPGTRIVSHSFDMGDWKPEKTIELGWRKVYFWTVTDEARRAYGEQGGTVDGEWVFTMPTPNGDMDAKLTLKTNGKVLSGTFVFAENRRLEIQDGTIEGKLMKFTVKRDRQSGGVMVYKMTGTVDGDQIKGSTEADMDGQAVTQEWKAKRK
jgi:SAM-dependent methyltransferase